MKKNYFRYLFWIGFLVWIIGSAIHGWNAKAVTISEKYTDFIGGVFMLYGGVGDILKGLKIFKNYEGDTFNNKEFTYIDKRPGGKTIVKTNQ